MSSAIPLNKVRRIKRLLRYAPLSQRDIARLTRTSRTTVAKIARGERYADVELFRAAAWADEDKDENDDVPPEEELPPPVRCRRCGALVYAPCLACRVRDQLQLRRALQQPLTAHWTDGEKGRPATRSPGRSPKVF